MACNKNHSASDIIVKDLPIVMMYFFQHNKAVKCEPFLEKRLINIRLMKTGCFVMQTEGEKKKA